MTDSTCSKMETVALKPCPFCDRNMKYSEIKWAFVWEVHIEHEYDKSTLYSPCPMRFYKEIPWKDRSSGKAFNEDWVKRRKEQFIESWNRRATNPESLHDTMKKYREKYREPIVDDRAVE